eukprot:18306_1
MDDDTLRERQNELLDVLGGLRHILSTYLDSLPRSTLLSLCNLLYPPEQAIDLEQMNTLEALPDELIHLVCNYLNVIDLKNVQCTSCQFAIIGRQELSCGPALKELNKYQNNERLTCSIGFKQDIVSLIQTDNINTKFLHLSSLISSNLHEQESLIQHGVIGKLVEFIKYDNKKCNFKYKYEAMKILIDVIKWKAEEEDVMKDCSQFTLQKECDDDDDELIAYNRKYLVEVCSGYDVLRSFHTLCQSEPVSKLLHYTSAYTTHEVELNSFDRHIMSTDDAIVGAFRWDTNVKRWRECGDGRGRVAVYQNIQTGMHKLMFIASSSDEVKLLQYIDNQQGVTWNSHDCSIYWRGDDYCMHTNGTWKFIFDHGGKSKYIQQAIQLHDCFMTYSCRDNQSVGAKIITQLDSSNIFDHFYWLTLPLQTQILNILQSDVPSLNELGLREIYLFIREKNNRVDEIHHMMHCGVIHKIVSFVTPFCANWQLVVHAIKVLLCLMQLNPRIVDYYDVVHVFYCLLCRVNEEDQSQVLQHIIEAFGAIATLSDEWRHAAIKIGALEHILSHVLEYNAIVQSASVLTIYKFFKRFSNRDFSAMMMSDDFDKIPVILIKLVDKSDYYDDTEMQQQLLLTCEAFCDGTNSEYRSQIVLSCGCLEYVGLLLKESIQYISPKKNFDIESSCIRIIGNVLCDCIWSDFEDETVQCLDRIGYLQMIHQLFNHTKLCRDILWSLSNVLISNKGIAWIMTYDPIIAKMVEMATDETYNNQQSKLKTDAGWSLCNAYRSSNDAQKQVFLQCGFVDVLLSLVQIQTFNATNAQQISRLMQQIVNDNNHNNESQLQHILERHTQSDQTPLRK